MNDYQLKKFKKAYLDALVENSILKPIYKGLNMFTIVNEWIESPELTEIPKELQIELCKLLRSHYDNVSIISYKKIVETLKKYDYEYIEDVISGMKKYNALERSYLLVISVDVDESDDFQNNKTLNIIKSNYNDAYDNAYNVFQKIYDNKYADGLTVFHRDDYDPEDTYSCIFINRKSSNMKDTLEHELTHFVKRVALYGNKFPKTYSSLKTDLLKNGFYSFTKVISLALSQCDKNVIIGSSEILRHNFSDTEEHSTIKSIVNAFIRRYETSNEKVLVDHKEMKISQIESLKDIDTIKNIRINWLNDFLKSVNNYDIFNNNTNILNEYFNRVQYKKDYEVEFLLKCLSYLCFKQCYPEYDIDKIIKANFEKFKFRDV